MVLGCLGKKACIGVFSAFCAWDRQMVGKVFCCTKNAVKFGLTACFDELAYSSSKLICRLAISACRMRLMIW